MPRRAELALVEQSFLRRADPRAKLALALATSTAVMLPLRPLAVVFACYLGLVIAAGIWSHALSRLRRMWVLLAVLFALDGFFIGVEFAVLISLRLALLVTAFDLVFATTTPDELQRALEGMGIPSRLAFTFVTAYGSLGLLEAEWRGIVEAQRARGIVVQPPSGRDWRHWRAQLASVTALVVPAVVLATQRAWSLTEAVAVRGFESPRRRPPRAQRFAMIDYLLLLGAAGLALGVFACR